jgi:hypothetical protein
MRPMAMARAFNAPLAIATPTFVHREVVDASLSQRQPVQKASKLSPKLAGFKTGSVTVQLWLTDTNPATVAKLKALGVEVLASPKSQKMLIAKVPAEKLQALAALTEVKFILPAS